MINVLSHFRTSPSVSFIGFFVVSICSSTSLCSVAKSIIDMKVIYLNCSSFFALKSSIATNLIDFSGTMSFFWLRL